MAASRCTFFFPPALASLRSLPSTADRRADRDVAGVTGDGRVQPRVAGRGPHLPVRPDLAQRLRRRRLAPPPGLLSFSRLLPPPARGDRRRDLRVQRRGRQPRPTAPPPPHQHPAGPAAGPAWRRTAASCSAGRRAHPAPCAASTSWSQPAAAPRDRQRTGIPARHPRHQHRQQRAQRMPDPRGLRGSVSRSCSTSRSDAAFAGDAAPAAPR